MASKVRVMCKSSHYMSWVQGTLDVRGELLRDTGPVSAVNVWDISFV